MQAYVDQEATVHKGVFCIFIASSSFIHSLHFCVKLTKLVHDLKDLPDETKAEYGADIVAIWPFNPDTPAPGAEAKK